MPLSPQRGCQARPRGSEGVTPILPTDPGEEGCPSKEDQALQEPVHEEHAPTGQEAAIGHHHHEGLHLQLLSSLTSLCTWWPAQHSCQSHLCPYRLLSLFISSQLSAEMSSQMSCQTTSHLVPAGNVKVRASPWWRWDTFASHINQKARSRSSSRRERTTSVARLASSCRSSWKAFSTLLWLQPQMAPWHMRWRG